MSSSVLADSCASAFCSAGVPGSAWSIAKLLESLLCSDLKCMIFYDQYASEAILLPCIARNNLSANNVLNFPSSTTFDEMLFEPRVC